MEKALVDVPVLLLFFVRYDLTKQVFEQIRKARPSKLYLYQDGPRKDRPDDIENIRKCREIVENIDWECEVHKHYNEENFGCDPCGYLSRKWMFETEEYGIILEDDTVPGVSFFRFCGELLEKYKDDQRIHMICGYNMLDKYSNSDADYFFSNASTIWGWATWKRVFDTWEPKYDWLDDPEMFRIFLSHYTKLEQIDHKNVIPLRKKEGKEYFETLNAASMMLNSRVSIVATKNMIKNIGIGVTESTHASGSLNLLRPKIRKLFNKEIFEYEFPLKHPKYIACDLDYKKLADKAYGNTVIDRILSFMWAIFVKIKGVFIK